MKTRSLLLILCAVISAISFSSCSQGGQRMMDGYYSAEGADYDSHGWIEYITIYVSDNKIVTVEYNARNASGFIKSWDMNYMNTMNAISGTYPNEYARTYSVSLLNWQDPSSVDAVTGATHSHVSFQLLANAAIEQAKAGNKQVALVDLS